MSDESFELAARFLSETTCMNPSNENKLIFYKYYKQATVGDCNTPKPGMFDLKEKAKWEAWNSVKGMDKDEAKKAYVDHLTMIQPKWREMCKC